MRLDRAERKEIRWPFSSDADPPLATADVCLAGEWHEASVEGVGDATVVMLLVAGPDATGNPAGTAVLPTGLHWARIRFLDNPEILVESGGPIAVF